MDHGRVAEEVTSRIRVPDPSVDSRRRTWFPCGFLILLCICAAGCETNIVPGSDRARTLTIGVPEGLVQGTDLGIQSLVTRLSVEGLTFLGEDGRALPNLAEGWSWEAGDHRLRIRLRPNVTFHDGTPLTAQLAAKLVEEAIQRPANRMLFTSLSDVTAVRADGTAAIVIDLSKPSAFLPEDLELPLSLGTDRSGTGPYKVVERSATAITLRTFEEYHAGTPRIQQVVVKSFDRLRPAWVSLLRGEVDLVTDVPPDAVQFIKNDEVAVVPFSRRYQLLVAFNSRRTPFDRPLVRRALNYAVDREAIVRDVLRGQGQPSAGPLWPKHWAYDKSIPQYSFSPNLAASLLDAAGLPSVETAGKAKSRFRFTCLIPAKFALIERLGLAIQRQLYDVGVDMQFEVVPVEEFNKRVTDGRFEAILSDMAGGPTFGRAYLFFASRKQFQGLNVFGYENPETERLFEVLRRSTNEGAVRSATRNLQRVLLDDPPAVFLVWTDRARAVRRQFNVVSEPGRDPLFTIWRWTVGPPVSTE